MEGSGDNLSTDGLRYLESAFLKLLSEEVQNRCSNFEEFYGELDNQGDKLMETDSSYSNGIKINTEATRRQYRSCSTDSTHQDEQRTTEKLKSDDKQDDGVYSNQCYKNSEQRSRQKEPMDSYHKQDENRLFEQFSKSKKKGGRSRNRGGGKGVPCKDSPGCTSTNNINKRTPIPLKTFNLYEHEYYLKCILLKDFLFHIAKLCWQKTKEITLLVLCLLLIVLVFLWRILWFILCFVFKLVLFVVLWLTCSAINCLSGVTNKYDVFGKIKVFFMHTNDLVFLITGFNLKSMFTRSKVQATPSGGDGEHHVNVMPTTPEEAVTHLLQYEDKPLRALCVSPESTNEEIKGNYRKLALLVHPDKYLESQGDEAFKVLDSAFKTLTDPEKREKLMEEDRRRKEWEQFTQRYSNFEEDFETVFNDLLNSIACSKCEGKHRRTLVKDRTFYEARWCSDCNAKHSANDGDVWAENSLFGLNWTCYVCMDGEIFELTEWAECQDLRSTIPVNSHRIVCRLGNQANTEGGSGRRRQRNTESTDSKRTRKQKRRQKGKKL